MKTRDGHKIDYWLFYSEGIVNVIEDGYYCSYQKQGCVEKWKIVGEYNN